MSGIRPIRSYYISLTSPLPPPPCVLRTVCFMAVFSLPLAHSDFQQTANVTDALHSLQRLDEATSSIFARLLSRIGHETEVSKKWLMRSG